MVERLRKSGFEGKTSKVCVQECERLPKS